MKRSLAFTLFYICAPLLLVARTIQQLYMIDLKTGFFLEGFELSGAVITYSCIGFALVLLIMCRLTRVCAGTFKQGSRSMCIASLFAAACLIIDAAITVVETPSASAVVIAVVSLAAAVCMAWYGLSFTKKVAFAPQAMLIMVVYAIVRLLVGFSYYAGEVSIADSVFDIVAMCLSLLFFVANAKIVCGIATERTVNNFYAFGLSATLLCACEFMPRIVALLTGNAGVLHGGSVPDFSCIAISVYAIACVHTLTQTTACDEAVAETESDQSEEHE